MLDPNRFLQNVAVCELEKRRYEIIKDTVYSGSFSPEIPPNTVVCHLGPPRNNSTLGESEELKKYPSIRGLYKLE